MICTTINTCLANETGTGNEIGMYYDVVASGARIKKMRSTTRMTRNGLAEEIGISVDALRKIESGKNGAKIDTLVVIADYFHVTLDYLICGCENNIEMRGISTVLNEKETMFLNVMLKDMIKNIDVLK